MLILIKNNEGKNYNKTELGELLGVGSSSVQIWRKLYENGGIDLLWGRFHAGGGFTKVRAGDKLPNFHKTVCGNTPPLA